MTCNGGGIVIIVLIEILLIINESLTLRPPDYDAEDELIIPSKVKRNQLINTGVTAEAAVAAQSNTIEIEPENESVVGIRKELFDWGRVENSTGALLGSSKSSVSYQPNWDSLDARPLPTWYDNDKIGIFIHWGVYAVPGISTEWFWYNWKSAKSQTIIDFMAQNYPPGFTYGDFGSMFTTELFNASYWADLFQKAGAKYVVLTSKHHDGYCLWPSKYAFNWNSMDVGPNKDLVGELATAIRNRTTIKFGLYHSLYEWFNPLWLSDKSNNLTTNDYVQFHTLPSLYELVNTYSPEIIWSDGEWEASDDYWMSKEFLAWLYNESPVRDSVVTNDRWGSGDVICKHGGFYTCADRYNPGVLQPHKWENCMTLDRRSWGYRRNAKFIDYLTPSALIKTLIETISCGGNLLVNIGPNKDGIIVPIQEERLLQMGHWLSINGEAIYSSNPWTAQNDTLAPGVWYTTRPELNKVYALLTIWPIGGEITLASVNPSIVSSIEVLGAMDQNRTIEWNEVQVGIKIYMPQLDRINSKWAWTIVINTK